MPFVLFGQLDSFNCRTLEKHNPHLVNEFPQIIFQPAAVNLVRGYGREEGVAGFGALLDRAVRFSYEEAQAQLWKMARPEISVEF